VVTSRQCILSRDLASERDSGSGEIGRQLFELGKFFGQNSFKCPFLWIGNCDPCLVKSSKRTLLTCQSSARLAEEISSFRLLLRQGNLPQEFLRNRQVMFLQDITDKFMSGLNSVMGEQSGSIQQEWWGHRSIPSFWSSSIRSRIRSLTGLRPRRLAVRPIT
jgi:hypothetical protein